MQYLRTAPLALLAMLAAIVPAAAHVHKEKVIHSFQAGEDGSFPEGGLVVDSHGNFYGTTQEGGSHDCGGGGCGTVFRLRPGGKETILHVFAQQNDGVFPVPGLAIDSDGNLYGTTLNGGGDCSCGSVFKVTPRGKETLLHIFAGGSDGAFPVSALLLDGAGNLYGTTSGGGLDCMGTGVYCGTVFKIAANGKFGTIYSFTGGSDGMDSTTALFLAQDGNFYGTTDDGGVDCDGTGQGCGTIFKLTPEGSETVLYRFEGGSHGAYPAAGVTMDGAGNLFGTTNNGGFNCDGSGAGCGVVFELTADGQEFGLHTFAGGDDGANPQAAPVSDAAGNLYGTTVEGGSRLGGGVVYQIKPGGQEKILYAFSGGRDGGGPFAGLIMDVSGNLYGTTFTGGTYSGGTVFRVRN
ncbi:MAG TPA: choice-of-anchor tandem repeat GloVer-containing protein [Rhizomicrobium sp.]|jgi:uncharacterized repeat protein (TIGR03803 family)